VYSDSKLQMHPVEYCICAKCLFVAARSKLQSSTKCKVARCEHDIQAARVSPDRDGELLPIRLLAIGTSGAAFRPLIGHNTIANW
jgi:uncharacterized paraquat-inducible protein A